MTIAWAETLEQVEDLARLEDEVADCAKLIGEAFQLGAVFIDGHVYLIETAQLGLEVDDMVQFVVKEEPLDVIPQGEGGEVGLVDDVEDRFGDSFDGLENGGSGGLWWVEIRTVGGIRVGGGRRRHGCGSFGERVLEGRAPGH